MTHRHWDSNIYSSLASKGAWQAADKRNNSSEPEDILRLDCPAFRSLRKDWDSYGKEEQALFSVDVRSLCNWLTGFTTLALATTCCCCKCRCCMCVPCSLLFIITRKSRHLGVGKFSKKEQAGTKTANNKLAWVMINLKINKSPRDVSLEPPGTWKSRQGSERGKKVQHPLQEIGLGLLTGPRRSHCKAEWRAIRANTVSDRIAWVKLS